MCRPTQSDNSKNSGSKHQPSKHFKDCILKNCCNSCSYCCRSRAAAKERPKSQSVSDRNKTCQKCFFCLSLSFCPSCTKCSQCCRKSSCRRQVTKVLGNLAQPGFKSSGSLHLEGRLQPPVQDEAPIDQIPSDSQRIRQPSQKQVLEGGVAVPDYKTSHRKSSGSGFSCLLQPAVHSSQTKQQMASNLGFEQSQSFPPLGNLQNGNSRDHPNFPSKRRMGHISNAYFHIPINPRKYRRFHLHGQTFQFRALPFGLATAPLEFTKVVKEVKLMAQSRSIRIHQYLDDWLLRAPCRETCVSQTQTLMALCQQLGWVVNLQKSELVPQQEFNFVGYRFDLSRGLVKPTQERWQALTQKIKILMSRGHCSVREFMSLIGLLTATEKQVVSGRLHMRPIQWHLKNHWHVPEVLEKEIPLPRSLYPHLQWWLDEDNVLRGQPPHPLQHALQLFTDASNEGWGAHLGDHTAKGVWSNSESQLHINFLELKAVLLALKKFEQQCWGQIILIATDNTTVVSYINKEGDMRSGSLCALLWRLLSWCNRRQIVLRARHIPGRLNVIADKLSRSKQVIQTEWSLLQEVFDQLCARWHTPQVDLFATRYNHKLPKFVSPMPDPQAWRVDALNLNWENLDAYAFPPVSLLGKVVSKIIDQGVRKLVLIAPGWPNMPWFWDLVNMSVQIPLSLPQVENLLTQPFNQCPHRDLLGLNLHTWLLEPLAYKRKDSLMRWQQELRLLRDNQPEQSMNRSGPYLSNGASHTRWTSGHL